MRSILFFLFYIQLSHEYCIAQSHWNHLRNESSPYLRQHAHNPVDWYPWSQLALDKAKKGNKLLVISIGYASCHWCHVMEAESFSDTAVSTIMNASFVSIKVDREERPDIDQVYLSACQLVNHDGCGWPLNVIALPDGSPVYIGTYMKKSQWMDVLRHFAKQFQEEPGRMQSYANELTQGIQSNMFKVTDKETAINDSVIHIQVKSILNELDKTYGGFQGSPKFPLPAMFDFLLAYGKIYHQPEAIQSVYTILDHLMTGGIYDHLEGGFGRYSLDEEWKVPHFEKMLYDNAQLITVYAHAYQLSKNIRYKNVLKSTIDFIDQQLKSPDGAYYSSFDADASSDRQKDPSSHEGNYYVWTKDEIAEALNDQALTDQCNRWFNILDEGNALTSQQYHMLGKNVLSYARLKGQDVYPVDFNDSVFNIIQSRLLTVRIKRARPARDEKVICSWNALMVSALADAYMATGDETYKTRALTTGLFIWKKMYRQHALMRIYRSDKTKAYAFLDDYAYAGLAFVKLYQISFEEQWLKHAEELKNRALILFNAESLPLLYYTAKGQAALIARHVEVIDQDIPSSNAAMSILLLTLADYYQHEKDHQRAVNMIRAMHAEISSVASSSYYSWLGNALLVSNPPYEIAIVGNQYQDKLKEMSSHYIPYALWCGGKKEGKVSLLKNKLQPGETTIYVCQNNMCLLPVHGVEPALLLIKP